MLSRICCIVLLLIVCTGGYKIRDDEYDWPTPYDIRNIRNNGPDIEALDNLEPYQTDDLENGEIFYRVGRPIFGVNFPHKNGRRK